MAALLTMRLQTITYRGRPVACATATRFFLADDLERLPAGDPLLTFVLYMCAYAHDVLTGELPGGSACAIRRAILTLVRKLHLVLEQRLEGAARRRTRAGTTPTCRRRRSKPARRPRGGSLAQAGSQRGVRLHRE